MSPQLSLQHHYIIHKYQSQIKSTERGLHQSESTKKLSNYGTQSPWQLQICSPIGQEGEKIQVGSSCQAELTRRLQEPQQPWPASSTGADPQPPLLSVGSTERENVGKRGNGSETSLSPGLASSPASTPCAGAADAAGSIQLESRPWAGERTTLLGSTKSQPKRTKCSITPHLTPGY